MKTTIKSSFTKSLPAVLKKSSRLICQPDGDRILLCNGFCIWAFTPGEYAAIVQPVTLCDPGRWEINNGARTESAFDISGLWRKFVEQSKAGNIAAEAKALFPLGQKTTATALYSDSLVVTFNSDYLGTVSADDMRMITGQKDPVVIVSSLTGPCAAILPVKTKPEIVAAVKALHGLTATNDANETESLRAELEALKAARPATMEEAKAQPAEAPKIPAMKQSATTVENLKARFSSVPGLAVTVKGEHSAAPVLWFSGSVDESAEALKAAGARWSGKRSAYYIQCSGVSA